MWWCFVRGNGMYLRGQIPQSQGLSQTRGITAFELAELDQGLSSRQTPRGSVRVCARLRVATGCPQVTVKVRLCPCAATGETWSCCLKRCTSARPLFKHCPNGATCFSTALGPQTDIFLDINCSSLPLYKVCHKWKKSPV